MIGHNAVRNRKAQSGAPMIALRREERFKYSFQIGWQYSDAAVFYRHRDPIPPVICRCRNAQFAAGRHRLQGVMDQIQQHLFHLIPVDRNPRQFVRQRDLQPDVVGDDEMS